MLERLENFILGTKINEDLPARVRIAIQNQQIAGEKLICATQITIATLFLFLYIVSPRPDGTSFFGPVPIFLILYMSFTLLRLVFLTHDYQPFWLITLSVIIDMSLLLGLIWSFHIQYAQPTAFSLKAPTMLYAFIFITMRALIFEPRYVLLAGGVAVLGWGLIVIDAIILNPKGAVITHSFVHYITSTDVMIGAEIDKMIALSMVTILLTIALIRARRMMIKQISQGTVVQALSRFFSPEIAEKIAQLDQQIEPGYGELREATVMFTDIAGFTTISEQLQPAEVFKMLNEYFLIAGEAVGAHKGVINNFRGDAMLVTFNMPTDDPDHAANGLRAALALQAILKGRYFHGFELKTRVGLNTGPIIFGALGAPGRLDFTLYGDVVNVAARLEPMNKEYNTNILAAEATIKAAGTGFQVRALDEIRIRGKERKLRIFTIEDVVESAE